MLMSLPGWTPVAIDPDTGGFVTVPEMRIGRRWRRVWAVAAVTPPGFLRLSHPAAIKEAGAAPLPLWSYSAAGAGPGGSAVMSAIRVDRRRRWDAGYYEPARILDGIRRFESLFPDNRIVSQLSRCATGYFCSTARNLFMGRFEAALPVSRGCNSRCIGCISRKHGDHPCSQERIGFRPDPGEGIELAAFHMSRAKDPIVSFGQGCEGEPLIEAELVSEIISGTRKATPRGVFHMNTNGSLTEAFLRCADAGLQSVRVSLNSAVGENYRLYFRPVSYTFGDVAATLRAARSRRVFSNINLQVFPGITDTPAETGALVDLCRETGVEFIQLRNLSIDPSIYPPAGFGRSGGAIGMLKWLGAVKKALPGAGMGCYNSTMAEIEAQRSR
jgi:hypothetical protein